jgi:SulP family sulfate permease
LLKDNRSKFDNTSFENHIASILGQNALIPDLINVMTRFDLDTGETLIRSGDEANDVYIVADGRIKVEIGLHDGTRLRLRSMTKGAIVGEIGQYLKQKRSADIVVEDRATLYRMSTANLEILDYDTT